MLSFTDLKTKYGKLTQNTSTANTDSGGEYMNIYQRYLLEKYYSNEGSFSMITVGSQSLTATATLSANTTSLTLTTTWLYHTTQAIITFSSGDTRLANFSRGSTAVTWAVGLTTTATTALSVGGLQFYPLPPNYSKLKTITITQGNLKWVPTEILSRPEWDNMNMFPLYSDIPNYYYIYGGQIGIWPIPATTGNVITENYKYRIPDLSIEDYAVGTVAVSNGGTTITGSGTTWTPTTNVQNESRWIKIAQTKGDNLWYQVQSVDSATSITLYEPYQGITVSGGTYTLGQMPILIEDFHDMLLWYATIVYYSSIVKDQASADRYQKMLDMKLELLNEYAGSKSINVDLSRVPANVNPNLFQTNIG